MNKISEKLYGGAAGGAEGTHEQASGEQQSSNKDEKVVDAEFEEVKDDHKKSEDKPKE
jgi:molecular chaperone DnaK